VDEDLARRCTRKNLTRCIEKYRNKGIVVDTNLLLVYLVGLYSPDQISEFKRTKAYTIDEFHLLRAVLSHFRLLVTTPNILTEVSNLGSQLPRSHIKGYFQEFRQQLQLLSENYVPASSVCACPYFEQYGLTDSVIAVLSQNQYLVLTADARLAYLLEDLGVDVLNFNHIRYLVWP